MEFPCERNTMWSSVTVPTVRTVPTTSSDLILRRVVFCHLFMGSTSPLIYCHLFWLDDRIPLGALLHLWQEPLNYFSLADHKESDVYLAHI